MDFIANINITNILIICKVSVAKSLVKKIHINLKGSLPVRTLMAPCTALTSPLTNISMSSEKSCGQASGQSQ